MCEPETLDRIAQAARALPEPAALKALACLEDLLDLEEARKRMANPLPPIPLESIIHEFGLEDEFDPRAKAEFSNLEKAEQRRIVKFLGCLLENPRLHGAALRGEALGDFWKYRVGDYRLIADIQDRKLTILIVAIGHRSSVYR